MNYGRNHKHLTFRYDLIEYLISELYPYQIFRSLAFRSGMGFLTAHFLVAYFMGRAVHTFRKHGITSDFTSRQVIADYMGATPIMGGAVMIPVLVVSVLLWAWPTIEIYSMITVLIGFGLIGFYDDWSKISIKKRIERNEIENTSATNKSEGVSESFRIIGEILIATAVVLFMLYWRGELNTSLQIPFVPIKAFLPELPYWLFVPFVVIMVVAGTNAVNMTDGLDSLVSVPLICSLGFVGAVAYISGDEEWSGRLLIPFLGNDTKEITILCISSIGCLMAFLKFNSPPASIYMGDVGSLGFGGMLCIGFFLVKAELFLPLVGGVFFISGLSSLIQRVWFKIATKIKGREYARMNRFFYCAPYHHHKQKLLYHEEGDIHSIYQSWLQKLGLGKRNDGEKYLSHQDLNNKIIWNTHMKSVWFLIITLIIFFKVR